MEESVPYFSSFILFCIIKMFSGANSKILQYLRRQSLPIAFREFVRKVIHFSLNKVRWHLAIVDSSLSHRRRRTVGSSSCKKDGDAIGLRQGLQPRVFITFGSGVLQCGSHKTSLRRKFDGIAWREGKIYSQIFFIVH